MSPAKLKQYSHAMQQIFASHFDMENYINTLDQLGIAAYNQNKPTN